MEAALVCTALLGVLLFGLGFIVSITRGRTNTAAGSSGDPTDTLHKLVRAHGNTSEYVGMLAVLILVAGSREPASWAVASMIGATASRYLLAAGIIMSPTLEKPQPLRFIGALGTYGFGVALCVAIFTSL
jgi:uncharacterized membrane protein YecN with MAPEG domain